MSKYRKAFFYTLASILVIAALYSVTISVSPAAAMVIGADLPIVKELVRLDEENHILKNKIEYNSEIMENYKHTITDEDRNMVGEIVLRFIAAQYSNDKEKMYSLCTDKLKGILKSDPPPAEAYGKDIELKLVIVSNIAKEDDKYMAFIRIEDSRADSQYQENFYLEKLDDNFLITMIEQDK